MNSEDITQVAVETQVVSEEASNVSTPPSMAMVPINVETTIEDSCYLDIPPQNVLPDGDTSSAGSRRCSARVLSMNLQHTLRQLRREEHSARVSALIQRNAVFYKRQRFCECITMLSVLIIFTSFSLYIVFAHGFHFGKQNPFNLVQESPRKIISQEDNAIDLMCQTDSYWEWCRWVHFERFCDFEWVSRGSGVQQIGCDFPDQKVEFIGDYDKFECGLRVHNLGVRDRGVWMCEVEKYYTGFSRRYGEFRTSIINMVVREKPRTSTTSSPSPTSTRNPMASALTPNSALHNSTTINPVTEIQDYERQFFMLRMFVLGTIGTVLSTLALTFWIYFMYLWHNWDTGKRDSGSNNNAGGQMSSFDYEEEFCDKPMVELTKAESGEGIDQQLNGADVSPLEQPHINLALVHSRRKSVSFAVCKVDEDTMSFNIEHKSVLVGDMSQHSQAMQRAREFVQHAPSSPLLTEVAKRWQAAKSKLIVHTSGGGRGKKKDRKSVAAKKELFEFSDELKSQKAAKRQPPSPSPRPSQHSADVVENETTM